MFRFSNITANSLVFSILAHKKVVAEIQHSTMSLSLLVNTYPFNNRHCIQSVTHMWIENLTHQVIEINCLSNISPFVSDNMYRSIEICKHTLFITILFLIIEIDIAYSHKINFGKTKLFGDMITNWEKFLIH